LPGLERSRAPHMADEYQVRNEDEDPRVRLDRLEQGMATLTSMVSQLLVANVRKHHQ
jgi:hypothetical protein